MRPTIKPTIKPQIDPDQAHQQNVSRILEQAFGSELMAQVNSQGLDLEFLFGAPPAPKNKKRVYTYTLVNGEVKSSSLMLDEWDHGVLKSNNKITVDGTVHYRFPETAKQHLQAKKTFGLK